MEIRMSGITRENHNTYQAWFEISSMLDQAIPEEFIHPPNKKLGIYGKWWSGSVCKQRLNQIFGPGAWDSEVIDHGHFWQETSRGQTFHAWAVVQIVVRGLDDEGSPKLKFATDKGAASAIPNKEGEISPQQIRTALMGAVTFALKRAAAQLGRATGGQLYHEDDEAEDLWPEAFVDESRTDLTDEEPAKPQLMFPVPEREGNKIKLLGKEVDADDNVSPARMVGYIRKKVLELPEFKSRGAGAAKYFKNHLQKWFDASDIGDLTWEQVAALLHYGETGLRPAPWYTVKVSSEADDVDAIAEIASLITENDIPESLVKELSETFFGGKTLGADEAKLLYRAMKATFDKHGLEGLVNKEGEASDKVTSVLEILLAEAHKEPPF